MKQDPFGNLNDWGCVLEIFDELAENGRLTECQAGLIRILRYKGNWRLREEVLKRVGDIKAPSNELILQVLAILADDNIYYDARILAGEALTRLMKGVQDGSWVDINHETRKIVEKLRCTPQPPFFDEALKKLDSEVGVSSVVKR
jgi:hypothetical protein